MMYVLTVKNSSRKIGRHEFQTKDEIPIFRHIWLALQLRRAILKSTMDKSLIKIKK